MQAIAQISKYVIVVMDITIDLSNIDNIFKI